MIAALGTIPIFEFIRRTSPAVQMVGQFGGNASQSSDLY